MATMMNQETYDSILEILSREPTFSEGIRHLQKSKPEICNSISEKTLKSTQAQYYVRRMRRCHHQHYSRETREKYYKLYKEAKSQKEEHVIMRLAAKNDISPCLLARIILEEYYWNDVDHGKERSEGRGLLPPGFMTDCIRDIAKLPNPELAREIYETTVLDNFYGPAVDSIKKTCGVEYELILKAECMKAGFTFIDEDQMREEGYDKTPDIRLKVPVLIDNRVVNWFESKASFGDPINHQQYMIDQYLPYKNRFGPGAVIYWFGFVEELAETGERGILLLNKFPEKKDIICLQNYHNTVEETNEFIMLRELKNDKENFNISKCDDDDDDRFCTYVDPMFDSDDESDLANYFKKILQPSKGSCEICGEKSVDGDSNLECNCIRLKSEELAVADLTGDDNVILTACNNDSVVENCATGSESLTVSCSSHIIKSSSSDLLKKDKEKVKSHGQKYVESMPKVSARKKSKQNWRKKKK